MLRMLCRKTPRQAAASPSPDSPVGCSRWDSVNIDFRFNTEDRLVLGLTLGRHFDLYSVGARRCWWRWVLCPCGVNGYVTVIDVVFAHKLETLLHCYRVSDALKGACPRFSTSASVYVVEVLMDTFQEKVLVFDLCYYTNESAVIYHRNIPLIFTY